MCQQYDRELLPKISVHNICHTACTNMAKYGMNIKVLQYLMGHANSDVTLDVYDPFGSNQDVREEVERYALVVDG
ncbi:MAG: tyrosine-type recombinase/integrase [Lachnospiraceae bacterium]|nr:tyrosine-type recombinase/integrase [Lachnospiraceae bacterium]